MKCWGTQAPQRIIWWAFQMKNIVVMTATIAPKSNASNLARTDPDMRRCDYEQALRFYLQELADGAYDQLVFAENSDSDLGTLRALAADAGLQDKVAFLSIYGLDYPPEYSRGYGEFLLVDRVMDSPLLRAQDPDSVVWKVTGRYRVANIAQLIRRQPQDFDLYCNCRDYPQRWTDQHIQAWRVGAYARHLTGIYECFKEARSSEQILRDLIDNDHFGDMHIVPRFTSIPIVEGARGWDNEEYSAGLKNRGKLLLRQIANGALPGLWV
jgi:hypothetical protein